MFFLQEKPIKFEEFKNLFPLKKFSEGYRGNIYLFIWDSKKYAVKVPLESKLIPSIKKEASILKFLNEKKISFVSRVVYIGEDFFVYEFIEGIVFKKLLNSLSKESKDLKFILRKLLISAYCLDKLGVFKDEFQRPFTNVLVQNKRIYLIDFERGALNKFWKNVPQLIQFLLALGILNKDETIYLGKLYKKNPKYVIRILLKRLT